MFDKLDHLPKFDIDIFSQQVDVHQLEKQASTGASPSKNGLCNLYTSTRISNKRDDSWDDRHPMFQCWQ